MSVYWIVLKTSIWTQDLLGGFPYSSAVYGFKWMSRLWSTPKNLGNSFSDPQRSVNNIVAAGAWKVFSKFAIFGVPPPCWCFKLKISKATNKSSKMHASLQIRSWHPDLKLVGISTKSMNSHFGAQKRSNSHIDEFHGSPGEIAKKILKYSRVFCMFFGIEQFFS